jgi:lysozyme
VGIPTVGVGHNLNVSPLPDGWTYPLSDEEVNGLLAGDLLVVFSALDAHLGWWRTLTYARQRVLANMCFNMGINGLLGFHNTLQFIQDGAYEDAAKGMISSKWASQVGQRANRLADMMVQG